jgi:hypothetical protein
MSVDDIGNAYTVYFDAPAKTVRVRCRKCARVTVLSAPTLRSDEAIVSCPCGASFKILGILKLIGEE